MGEYILKSIDLTLDERSIEKAIEEVMNQVNTTQMNPALSDEKESVEENKKDVEVAKAELIFFPDPPYMSGALQDSIQYRVENGQAFVTAGEGLDTKYGSYAMFVEFGTGIIGKENPHPLKDKVGYEYDANHHGHRGWWYPAPWGTNQADDGAMLAWTEGMPARPFMYNTLQDLAVEAEATGGRVIAEYIRGERA